MFSVSGYSKTTYTYGHTTQYASVWSERKEKLTFAGTGRKLLPTNMVSIFNQPHIEMHAY